MKGSGDHVFIRSHFERKGIEVQEISSLAGGSINKVYLLRTSQGAEVMKINDPAKFPGMFAAEKEGLEELAKAQVLDVPKVLEHGETEAVAFLRLEYKKEATQKEDFWRSFAEGLASLHKKTSSSFGFISPNYIGSLPQYNDLQNSAAEFYINQRLKPQLRMAAERGFSFKNQKVFLKNISEEIPEEPPALIHGDLWSGNYMSNEKGMPCLIDPAVSYAPREMDLAMMKLFGGFPEEVFVHYDEVFPLSPGFKNRVPLWQLYYLLVHLNIFGSSYLAGVENILKRFS